jgi:hypothetical protein
MFTDISDVLASYIVRAVMMEAASTSEMFKNFYQTTLCNNTKDSNLHANCDENLKSHFKKKNLWFKNPADST